LKNILSKIYAFLIYAFLYAPIVVLIVFSFNESRSRGQWGGFSLKWYEALFQDQILMQAMYNTVLIAVLSATIATIIGTLAAIAIDGMDKWSQGIFMNVTYLPVLNPDIVTGVSLMLLFLMVKINLGFQTLLLSHVIFNIPYVIIAVLPKLQSLNRYTMEAALDLGATPLYAYRHVILPQIKEGIFTGFLFAFTLSLDDFVISFFTTGSGVNNLAIVIYSMAKRGLNPKINAVLTLVFVAVMILLTIVSIRSNREENKKKRKNN